MIKTLNNKDQQIAEEILAIQVPAYEIEADLIGFHGIPQLKDTVETVMASKENFKGFFLEHQLVGFISYEETKSEVDICRLVVDPEYFRQGIARSLLLELIQRATGRKILVSTGSKNVPAITLYEEFGFARYHEVEIARGIYLSQFAR
ncbi:GNAT family N-acetyltransferase [Oceanobacillus sp. 143]|uniref:GNAT family N-acetyltransferase n=1 Tax=Oceanobacillus zhaokaii TaxID=2052660 RepID=A0A345PD21_9BACI|nr:GNAT family N-acetyltransferase [Oceanobacillus zhaokaii]AXI07901.1 GNAT family N-acetyltransferase [Oceanobacillus zhaokaii]QGS67970.1 GNAT family N-acetyltransferase [Oceanobacillus sp. 143]